MGLLDEAARQAAYLHRMSGLLGWPDALRFRSAMFGARFGRPAGATLSMRHRSLAHPVGLRLGSTDAEVYQQVVRQAEYAPVAMGDPRVIVDCGANVGYTSAYFLSRFPRASVVAIEPFAANAALCRANLAPYGERARVIEAAVWSAPGRLALDHDDGNEWGVRVRLAGNGARHHGEPGGITAIDLPSLGLPRIDILKIDIEGSEAELFANGAGRWLPSVGSIAIELHGAACERAFRAAMADYRFREIRSGELTICLDIAPRVPAAASSQIGSSVN